MPQMLSNVLRQSLDQVETVPEETLLLYNRTLTEQKDSRFDGIHCISPMKQLAQKVCRVQKPSLTVCNRAAIFIEAVQLSLSTLK